MRRTVYIRILVLLLVLLATSGCSTEEVIGNLSEKQAAMIVVVLSQVGVSAEREKESATNTYRIRVPSGDVQRALTLVAECIPPDDRPEIAKTSPLSPVTPEMQALRMDHTLALEVERALLAYPGVIYSRANVSKFSIGARSGGAPAASLVVRYLSTTGNVPFIEEDLRRTVSQIVPGLRPADIVFSASNVIPSRLQGVEDSTPPAASAGWWRSAPALLLGALFVTLGSGFGFFFGRWGEGRTHRAARTRKPTDKVRVGEGFP